MLFVPWSTFNLAVMAGFVVLLDVMTLMNLKQIVEIHHAASF